MDYSKMELSSIEKNNIENIDLLQIESLSDLPTSKNDIIVVENNTPVSITLHKLLLYLGLKNVYVCENIIDGIKIFSDFNNRGLSIPFILSDGLSIENMASVVKELFEIQPSAKILILTAKEKTHPEITSLFNLGISSIVSKPINLDGLRSALSFLFEEKNDDTQQVLGQKKLELLLSSSKLLSLKKISDFLKILPSELSQFVATAIKNGVLIRDDEILEAICNQCNSSLLSYTSKCPKCQGINFTQQTLIEHYKCGGVFPKETDYTMCKKCNIDLGLAGRDYGQFSSYYECNSCGDKFSKPLFGFSCIDCGNVFNADLALWEKNITYKILK